MIICKKCKTEFKINQWINGKRYNLGKRKYCLNCSPFKKHNTRDLTKSKSNAPDVSRQKERRLFYILRKLPKLDWNHIQYVYDKGSSIRDTALIFNIPKSYLTLGRFYGFFKTRNSSEAKLGRFF